MSVTVTGLDDLIQHLDLAAHALTNPDLTLTVGATADYAGFVEGGTRFMSARPYLAPAEEQTAGEIAALYAAGVVEIIETGDTDALRRNLEAGGHLLVVAAQSIVHVVTGNLRASIYARVGPA